MQRLPAQNKSSDYYLQVVKREETPEWPRPARELIVGSQMLEGDFVQYWAYPKDAGKFSDEQPPVEVVASENPTPKPVIIIDQSSAAESTNDLINLILAKDGHAWSKTETSIENLEDNLNSLVDFAKEKFDISVEHFVTTPRVSQSVEKKLDEIETGSQSQESRVKENKERVESDLEALSEEPSIKKGRTGIDKNMGAYYAPSKVNLDPQQKQQPQQSSSKVALLIPVIALIIVALGVFMFKDKLMGKAGSLKNILGGAPTPTPTATPTPIQQPTPTPTISVDRSKYKIRVLNGTLQSGEASTLANKLKTLGWQVVKVGNAEDNNTEQTEVNVKKGLNDVGTVLASDVASDLQASVSASLSSSDSVDAEIIIGKK